MFTPYAPVRGRNDDHPVEAVWQNGQVTQSVVKWYGTGTRSEYRITRFGRDFPFRTRDGVGNLLILIPESMDRFFMFVLDNDADIDEIQAALGIQLVKGWASYDREVPQLWEGEDECIERRFRRFSESLTDFPPTLAFSTEAREALVECVRNFMSSPSDNQLLDCVDAEYRLFRTVERKVCGPAIIRLFESVDDFLQTAQSILQRRKARAGRSLEHHVEYLLRAAEIPFVPHPNVDGTIPDILIPGRAEYLDPAFPLERLFVLGIKTTCKDRWRQVTKEAPRIERKHLLTIQQGISSRQLDEMAGSKVTLVVPHGLHKDYPPDYRPELLTVERFVETVRLAMP